MNIKIIILILISVFTSVVVAAELPANTMQNLEVFSKKKLNAKTDIEEVKKNLELLLILDDEDPSRTAVIMLSKSYSENSVLYDQAIKEVENEKNSKKLSEIRTILRNYFKNGNG